MIDQAQRDECRRQLEAANGDYDQVSPWFFRDGKWGGFGPRHWTRAEGFGFAKGDVAEWDVKRVDERVIRFWKRIWVEADKKWRELTETEAKRLPILKQIAYE